MLNYAKIDDKLYIPSHIISPEFFTALPPGLGFTLGSTQRPTEEKWRRTHEHAYLTVERGDKKRKP